MNPEDVTYEDHAKAGRKNLKIILISLICVITLLGSLFLWVACTYLSTDFSLILKEEDSFRVIDGFLFPLEDDFVTPKDYVASYNLNTGKIRKYEIQTLDLGDYGLYGIYHYFRYQPSDAEDAGQGRIISADWTDQALCRANTETRFVFEDENGKKHLVDTVKRASAPLFQGSIQGVDPYGEHITQFSHNGLYAFGVDENTLIIYVRKSESTFAVGTVNKIDLTKYSGRLYSAYFVSESYLLLTFTDPETEALSDCLCDVRTGEVVECAKTEGAQNYEQVNLGNFAPVTIAEEDKPKDAFLYRYADVIRGNVFEHRLPQEIERAEAAEISLRGKYAYFIAKTSDRWVDYVSKDGGRYFCVDDFYQEILAEGEELASDRIYFLAENIVLANVLGKDGNNYSMIFKICF